MLVQKIIRVLIDVDVKPKSCPQFLAASRSRLQIIGKFIFRLVDLSLIGQSPSISGHSQSV